MIIGLGRVIGSGPGLMDIGTMTLDPRVIGSGPVPIKLNGYGSDKSRTDPNPTHRQAYFCLQYLFILQINCLNVNITLFSCFPTVINIVAEMEHSFLKLSFFRDALMFC